MQDIQYPALKCSDCFAKKGGGSDVQLSAVGKMCVGTAKTNQMPQVITILLKI